MRLLYNASGKANAETDFDHSFGFGSPAERGMQNRWRNVP